MKFEIALIRQGLASDENKIIGITNMTLNSSSEQELIKRKSRGAYPPVSLVFSSDLSRSLQTAQILYTDIPKIILKELRAQDYGEFENITYDELRRKKSYEDWLLSSRLEEFPGGEKPYALFTRSAAAFREICDEAAGKGLKRVAIITHRIIMQAILQRYTILRSNYISIEVMPGEGLVLECDTMHHTVKIIGDIK